MEHPKKYFIEKKQLYVRVLNKKISVNYDSILGISRLSEDLKCNDDFLLLDIKVQEFILVGLTQYLFINKYLKIESTKAYLMADKIALEYALKNYPDVPKSYWVKAMNFLVKRNLDILNFKRMAALINELKLSVKFEQELNTIKNNIKKEEELKETPAQSEGLKYLLDRSLINTKKVNKSFPLGNKNKYLAGGESEVVEYKHGKNNSIKITTTNVPVVNKKKNNKNAKRKPELSKQSKIKPLSGGVYNKLGKKSLKNGTRGSK
jgi:hypothetical protein